MNLVNNQRPTSAQTINMCTRWCCTIMSPVSFCGLPYLRQGWELWAAIDTDRIFETMSFTAFVLFIYKFRLGYLFNTNKDDQYCWNFHLKTVLDLGWSLKRYLEKFFGEGYSLILSFRKVDYIGVRSDNICMNDNWISTVKTAKKLKACAHNKQHIPFFYYSIACAVLFASLQIFR